MNLVLAHSSANNAVNTPPLSPKIAVAILGKVQAGVKNAWFECEKVLIPH